MENHDAPVDQVTDSPNPPDHEILTIRATSVSSPAFVGRPTSPIPSLHASIETPGGDDHLYNERHGINALGKIENADSKTPLPPQESGIKSPAYHSDDDETPRVSEFQLRSPPANRPQMIQRDSLLNDPISFLSTTSASLESSQPPSPITRQDIEVSIAQNERRDTPVWLQNQIENGYDSGGWRVSDPRVKVPRVLGTSLQALAEEQGGIPIRALASRKYHPSSNTSEVYESAPIPLLSTPEPGRPPRPVSPWENSALPHPLGGHPLGYLPKRSATMPVKTAKRPSFLPNIEAPKTGISFTRESVLSTPYPGSGFNIQRTATISNGPNSGRTDTIRRVSLTPGQRIPIIIRDSRNCTSAIGKIDVQSNIPSPDPSHPPPDDKALAVAILKEYHSLRGSRFFSARHLAGIKITFKSHSRDFVPPSTTHPPLPELSFKHLISQEEGRAAAFIAGQRAASRASSTNASIRHLEESLTFLLKKSNVGKDSYTCREDLMRLIVEAGKPDEHHGPRGTVALEIVEGWNWVKIGVVVATLKVLVVVAFVLWITIGVGGAGTVVLVGSDAGFGSARSEEVLGSAGWRDAGSRVAGGSVLAILILLLGWSGIGLWIGMSWLVV